jgi:GNAT superfamily N-acetyltransferase
VEDVSATTLDLRVELAAPDQLPIVIDLLEEAAARTSSQGLQQWAVGVFRADPSRAARGEVYLAWVADQAVGTFALVPTDPEIWPEANDDARYLHRLTVSRSWSGHQIGQQLLAWAEARVAQAGIAILRLDCPADSLVLPAYYERAGFEPRGEIMFRDVFGNEIPLLRYEKRLDLPPGNWSVRSESPSAPYAEEDPCS